MSEFAFPLAEPGEAERTLGKIDSTVPHTARVYAYQRGGNGAKESFAVDRAAAETLNAAMREIGAPDGHVAARQNRDVLCRFVTYLAEQGVDQFLDLGSGLPLLGDAEVHEVAQAINPHARAVYVDIDPLVVVHGRALLADTSRRVGVIQADLRDPDDVLKKVQNQGLLDLDRPVAVLLIAMLHCLSDDDHPADVVAQLRAGVAAGSWLGLTHLDSTPRPEAAARLQAKAAELGLSTPLVPRTRDVIEGYFDGWTLIEPGLVESELWRPTDPATAATRAGTSWMLAGLARR